jgi:hypothetical protein
MRTQEGSLEVQYPGLSRELGGAFQVARRPKRRVHSSHEQHRALEDKSVAMLRPAQPIQQPFQCAARKLVRPARLLGAAAPRPCGAAFRKTCGVHLGRTAELSNSIFLCRAFESYRACSGRPAVFCRCKKIGAPGAIRTRDLSLRRRILYPAELRAHTQIVAISLSTRRSALGHSLVTPLNVRISRLREVPDLPVFSARFEHLVDFFGGQFYPAELQAQGLGPGYYSADPSRVQRRPTRSNPTKNNPSTMNPNSSPNALMVVRW